MLPLLGLLFGLGHAASATEIFVSSVSSASGSSAAAWDGAAARADGSAAAPYQTLEQAQAAARAALLLRPLKEDVVVRVQPGTYYQRDALRFTAADAGRDGFRMRWEGPGPAAGTDPKAAAVVHGGVAVPAAGWKRVAPGSPIWATDVSALAPAPPARPGSSSDDSDGSTAPPPPAVANMTYAHCGSVDVGVAYTGSDLGSIMAGSIDNCCASQCLCLSTREMQLRRQV